MEVTVLRRAGEGEVAMKGPLVLQPRLPHTNMAAAEQIDQFTGVCAQILSEVEALL